MALGVCAGVHGRAAEIGEATLEAPLLVQRKSQTGFTIVYTVEPSTATITELSRGYVSLGWSGLTSVHVLGVEFVVEFMGGCAREACPYRVSPVLSDGTFGYPAAEGAWEAGWDAFASYADDAGTYLVMYKTGAATVTGRPAGSWQILRLVREPGTFTLDVATVASGTWLTSTSAPFSTVRSFALNGEPYVLVAGGDSTAPRIVRPTEVVDGVEVADVTAQGDWGSGWELFETFVVGGQWYLAQYDAEHPTEADAGQLRILELTDDGSDGLIATESGLGDWPAGVGVLSAFRDADGVQFFWQNRATGARGFFTLAPPDEWGTGLGAFSRQLSSSLTPPWDVVTLLPTRFWDAP